MMKKILAGAAAALTLGGALAATATPADAQFRGGYGGYHGGYYGGYHRGYGGGAVLGAGILGLAVGAAIAGDNHRYYAAPPPAYYYGPSYYSYYGGCHTSWRWDPYYRHYVEVNRCY
jgi:hypothetical protein